MLPVFLVYGWLVRLSWAFMKMAALFNAKARLFVRGRKSVFATLEKRLSPSDRVIWMHVASLGEFEQGLPILEGLRSAYPEHKLLVSFFSPSGYEVKKDSKAADVVVYLPMDIRANVRRFIALARPKLAIFVKYEIWPNYLLELKRQGVPALLVSARFKQGQVYFRGYGGFMARALGRFSHIFVQDQVSQDLLDDIGIERTTVGGDTRYDRVSEILEADNTLAFMDRFKGDATCLVAGSTWPEDEAILVDFINHKSHDLKYVLAPHNIKSAHIAGLKKTIEKRTLLYSEIQAKDPSDFEVLILDTIGLLTKVYSYADLAYVGGGFATGLHNTLEPAVFGIPIIIGPEYQGFGEAMELVAKGGITSIASQGEFDQQMERFLTDRDHRQKTGDINGRQVRFHTGATEKILRFVRERL